MEYIQYILIFLAVIFFYILITKVYMEVAAKIGEKLGIENLIKYMLRKKE